MGKLVPAALPIVLAMAATVSLAAHQGGAMAGMAQTADHAPLSNFGVHVRHANTGELAGSSTSNQAGQFAFTSLQPGSYVVEVVDATGKLVGLSPSITVSAGATVTVTVGPSAAGALAAGAGAGLSRFGLGPLASVAVAGAATEAAVTTVVATRIGKIIVCHKVTNTVSQTLEINESQRDAHLGHADTLGACPATASR